MRRRKRIYFVLAWTFILAGIASVGAGRVLAHPAPSVLHDYIVTLAPRALTVHSYLRISPELAAEVFRTIDKDGDGSTSEKEHSQWLQDHPEKLSIVLDGKHLQPEMSRPVPVSLEDLLVSISHPVEVTYTAAIAEPLSGKHRIQVTYGDNYLAYDEYYISVAGDLANDGKPHSIAKPEYPATYQIVYHMPVEGEPAAVPPGELSPAPWTAGPGAAAQSESGAPLSAASQAPAAQTAALGTPTTILDTLRTWRGEIWSALLMFALAVVLGALHALTPGHGKAMMAAYLVGSRGRVADAALLGGVVTATHTVGVVGLGIAILLASTFSVPQDYQPKIELASGIIITLLGALLLVARWRDLRKSSVNGQHPHDHDHDHTHDHTHPHPHIHLHSHAERAAAQGPSKRAIVGLGVLGGLLPCPDALAILLLAVGVGQFALGLGLVVAFSLGLAAVLIGLGIAVVKMKNTLEKRQGMRLARNPIWANWVPMASAALVVVIGVVMVATAIRV